MNFSPNPGPIRLLQKITSTILPGTSVFAAGELRYCEECYEVTVGGRAVELLSDV